MCGESELTMEKEKKRRTLRFILLGLLCILIVVGVILVATLPVTYTIDKSLIVKNGDYNVFTEERDGFTTLVKKDAEGNILDEAFKVIGFTDTHLDHNKEKGDTTMEYLIRNIVREKPDLVVFVGDNITSSFNERRAKQLCKVMEELGVYWDCVLGNHEGDNVWSISREKMVRIFASYPHCLVEAGKKYTKAGEEVWGHGNHVINLADSKGIYRSLFFIDGGADISEDDKVKYADEIEAYGSNYDYVKESQITWYKETTAKIAVGGWRGFELIPVPSAVFDHIAVPEYYTAYNDITGETEITQEVPAYNVENENGDVILMGVRRENVCCSSHNSGFFDAMLEMGSTDLMVCGHDHVNDFVLSYKGITLSYNEPSGYSSYNMITSKRSDTLITGYTLYTFSPDGSFTLEQIHNADLYPEAQETIKKLYQ